jgi:hypothetical protein
MKQAFNMNIFKFDRRCKTGERLVSTTKWSNRDEAEMKREVRELQYQLYPVSQFRIEFSPATMIVKSLMTGQDVEIDADTPWCCNPASESYWSM